MVQPRTRSVPPRAARQRRQCPPQADHRPEQTPPGSVRLRRISRIRPTERIPQIDVMVRQLAQSQVVRQSDRQEQPGIGHQAVIVKRDGDAVGLLAW